MARLVGDAYPSVVDPFFRRALELAERGRGTTSPNPLVGCVVVRDDEVLAEGFHERAGSPHAEAAAIAAAREAGLSLAGATAYVTLEPCAHHGRTPPCADALVAAGVARVVAGMRDPDPVAAGGAEVLRGAGIDVAFAEDPAPFEELNREWLHARACGRPFVRAKVALTLDGSPSIASGVRSSLTGQEARSLTMRLRAAADAVLVGSGTVSVDDPSLTVRDAGGTLARRQPLRVVLTRTELPSPDARLLTDGAGPVALLVPEGCEAATAGLPGDVRVLRYPVSGGVTAALEELYRAGVVHVLVEPGPRLLTALLDAGLVDELVTYHAGGFAGPTAPRVHVGESPRDTATLVRSFRADEAAVFGGDAVVVWRPVAAQQE